VLVQLTPVYELQVPLRAGGCHLFSEILFESSTTASVWRLNSRGGFYMNKERFVWLLGLLVELGLVDCPGISANKEAKRPVVAVSRSLKA